MVFYSQTPLRYSIPPYLPKFMFSLSLPKNKKAKIRKTKTNKIK